MSVDLVWRWLLWLWSKQPLIVAAGWGGWSQRAQEEALPLLSKVASDARSAGERKEAGAMDKSSLAAVEPTAALTSAMGALGISLRHSWVAGAQDSLGGGQHHAPDHDTCSSELSNAASIANFTNGEEGARLWIRHDVSGARCCG